MKEKDMIITFRLDEETAKEFKRICEEKETTASIQLRKMMKKYVNENKEDV